MNNRRPSSDSTKRKTPSAYCRACQAVGMSNCGHFDECDGATCITCHRPLNQTTAAGVRGRWPARYFADGPEGYFFTDDLKLARGILNAYDHDDDWTITDLHDKANER